MQKKSIFLDHFDKQIILLNRLYQEIISVNVSIYDKRYVFALKTQQFYTAIEDLFKQIAKSFENNIESMTYFDKEILARMNTEVPKIRPAVITKDSLIVLDKIRAFRYLINEAYDYELNEKELELIQQKLKNEYLKVENDLKTFRSYIKKLAQS